ncbi:DEKNAAC104031 [Brettanomyces naardenensis]|uniref:Peroxisomal ATPase PEX1 n=1 Tax=Brettanomyces naardenensis TaxID=13370 RepID=A0A448YQA7_BRENA|nr:DEKNAAC104031 [Brettanomyces naardenensis]
MSSIDVTVSFRQLHNCLINLPAQFISPFVNSANLLIQKVVIRLDCQGSAGKKHVTYCGWTGFFSSDPKKIEIDPSFAELSNIKESSVIRVSLVLDVPGIQSAELEPMTSEDWELTELYAGLIEDRFLNQIRALTVGQIIVVHPNATSSSSTIRYKVKGIHSTGEEMDLGVLTNNSELHIAPKVRKVQSEQNGRTNGGGRGSASSSPTKRLSTSFPPALLRGIALPHMLFSDVKENDNYDYCAFANLSRLRSAISKVEYVQISVTEGPGTPKKARAVKGEDSSICARTLVARLVNDPTCPEDTIGLSRVLAVGLGIEGTVGEKVLIEPLEYTPIEDISHLKVIIHEIITESPSSSTKVIRNGDDRRISERKRRKEESHRIQKVLKAFFRTIDRKVSLTNGLKLPIMEGLPRGGVMEIGGKHKKGLWFLLGKESVSFEKGETILKGESFLEEREGEQDNQSVLVGRDDIVRKVCRSVSRYAPLILYGASGSGKSLMAQTVGRRFEERGFYSKMIDCDDLLGTNSPEKLKKLFTESIIQELVWHEPSILILENADTLLSKEPEQGEPGLSTQMAELMSSQFARLRSSGRKISLILTGKSRDSINAVVFQRRLVEEEYSLRAPDKKLRFELLAHFLSIYPGFKGSNIEFLQDVSAEIEGYLPFDIESLCDRAFHDVVSSGVVEFGPDNFTRALSNYTPSSLRGVKLQKDTGTSWKDIGGLKEAKRVLLETLEWPTRYAPIFAKCPLRLRSGILLYGYPGCGKTLLASAVASQCGLNFISIKGPEILNKYIGASEQSVRELFERASAAKPCILFFDEFDSIAPKRGHDSTGVTDRIVNQLLTQMDGAEGLDGVYVLAATSRPDLIDSALLRPGRLDKAVICDMPDYDDRLDILKTIVSSSQFELDNGVKLEKVSERTQGFSGADLQALVYNSYLKAVHEDLDRRLEDDEGGNDASGDQPEYFVIKGKDNARIIGGGLAKKMRELRMREVEEMEENSKDREGLELTDSPNGGQSDNPATSRHLILTSEHFIQGLEETNKSISAKEQMKFQRIYSQFTENRREGNLPNGEASQDIGGRATLM